MKKKTLGDRLALAMLLFFALTSLLAGVLASDLPLACRVNGRLHLLPCLFRPVELAGLDNQSLAQNIAAPDWIWRPPIPFSPDAQHPGGQTDILQPPSSHHWLGTDDRGRDVMARLVYGTRVACLVGVIATVLSLAVGVTIGLGCALSSRMDALLSRLIETSLTFPMMFLLLAFQGLYGGGGVLEVAIAIALIRFAEVARLTRSEALVAAASPHYEAARSLGAGRWRLVRWHLFPFAIGPAIGWAAVGLGQAIGYEAALSFLGFGVTPPTPSWGELVAQAQAANLRPWLLWPPTIAIFLIVIACNRLATRLHARVARR